MNVTVVLLGLIFLTGAIVLVDVLTRAFWKSSYAQTASLIITTCRYAFPLLVIVFVVTTFFIAPFRVSSVSLEPTVKAGSILLIEKPSILGRIRRGDIITFLYPYHFHKTVARRVIGIPGDHISYINKTLYINKVKCPQTYEGVTDVRYANGASRIKMSIYKEDLDGIKYAIYQRASVPAYDFKNLVVPQNRYFVMGDNRDESYDSRYLGFIHKRNITGKAKITL